MKVVSGIKTIKKGSKGYEAKLFTKSNLVDFTEITDEQELFIDGSPSVVTSDGREPVTGYAGGTYIPATVNIDGVEYPNPSWYDGTAASPVAKARGTYGFFESWTNVAWREASDWTTSNATVSKEGNWVEVVTSSSTNFVRVSTDTPVAFRKSGCLLKKGTADTIYLGYSSTQSNNASYTWSTDTFSPGANTEAIEAIKLSENLVYVLWQFNVMSSNTLFQTSGTAESFYISNLFSVNDISFTPPFGQDGNASSDNRAYNCDKWDQPISFTFKPQFDYDTPNNQYILSGGGTGSDSPSLFYLQSSDYLRLFVYGAGFNFGHNGTNWTVNSNPFTDNSILQEEHTMEIYIDTTTITTSRLTVVLDGLKILDEVSLGDLSAWNKPNLFHLGFRQNGEEADTYISNFCVHPITQELPLDTGIQFTDPNTQYGRYAKWFLDQFGNTPYGSTLSSTGGIVEEGNNVNGSWVRFESGLLVQWGTITHTSYSTTNQNIGTYGWSYLISDIVVTFPVEYSSTPAIMSLGQTTSASCFSNITVESFTGRMITVTSTDRIQNWLAVGY